MRCTPTGRDLGRGLAIYGGQPRKIVENIGAHLCSMVHFGDEICILYYLMFDLDFERSILWHQVIKSGTKIDAFPCTEFTLPVVLVTWPLTCSV